MKPGTAGRRWKHEERKQKSIDTLMGALAEAESRAFYEEEDNVLNDLDELLNVF